MRELYEPVIGENFPYVGLEHIEQESLALCGTGLSSETQSTKKVFRAGDILFGTLRPYFRKVVRAKFDGVCSTDITVIRAKEKRDRDFLFYFIANHPFIQYATSSSSGTRMPRAKWSHLSSIEWNIPTVGDRKKIAAILSAHDDLIENNLRRIKILEEMAQTVYREWFVKFRFPGHQKVKMVDSPMGKIPEGWEVSMVGDNITVVPRKNKIRTGDYLTEGVIPVIDQGKDFIAGYIDDTFLAYDGPLPIIVFGDHTCVLKWVDFRFAVGADGTQLIQPEYPERLPPRFLFYTLQFVPLEQFGYQRHFKYLKEAKILIPSGNLARKFEEVVSSNTDLILNLQRQNLNLRRTRDLLLPKLISGELDVSELDITIPEANA